MKHRDTEHVHDWEISWVMGFQGAYCCVPECDAELERSEIERRLNEYETLKAENKRLKDLLEFNSALMSDVY